MEHSSGWVEVGKAALLSFAVAHPTPGVMVVSIRGELDSSTAAPLAAELDAVRRAAPERLVLDMSAVGFLSAMAVRMLLELHESCRQTETDLVLIPSPMVRRVLTLVALTELLGVGEPPPGEAGLRPLA